MLFTWLIATAIAVGVVATFFDEIMEWAKDVFNRVSGYVKKAWVYIRRVPGALKEMVRYIQYGKMYEIPKEVEWQKIEQMYRNGEIDEKTYQDLKANRGEMKVAELNREC